MLFYTKQKTIYCCLYSNLFQFDSLFFVCHRLGNRNRIFRSIMNLLCFSEIDWVATISRENRSSDISIVSAVYPKSSMLFFEIKTKA